MFAKDRVVLARAGDGAEAFVFSDRVMIVWCPWWSDAPASRSYRLECPPGDVEDVRPAMGSVTVIARDGRVWKSAADEPKLRLVYDVRDLARAQS